MAQTSKELQIQLDAAQVALDEAKTNLANAPLLQMKTFQNAVDLAQAKFNKLKVSYDAAYKKEVAANQAAKDKAETYQESRQPLIDKAQIELNTAKKYLSIAKERGDSATKIARLTTEVSTAETNLAAVRAGAEAQIVKVGNSSQTKLIVEMPPGGYVPASTSEIRVAEEASQIEAGFKIESDKAIGATTKIVTKNGVQIKVTTYADGTTSETPVDVSASEPATIKTDAKTIAFNKAKKELALATKNLNNAPKDELQSFQVAYNTALSVFNKAKSSYDAATNASSGAGSGAGTTKATAKTVIPTTDWEAEFRKYVPSKTWMLDLDRAKYPQLFALLKTAAEQRYYESEKGMQRFSNELDATDFYKELADSSQRRDIKALVGDLGFDSTDFSKFVSDSINFGWEGDILKQKTYEQVFSRNPDGSYTNPLAVTRAKKSNDYLAVQLTAKAYFNNASSAAVERVLTGQITADDYARQQREIAKTRYGHLSELIDQGVTLDDLASNYKSSASKLLEIDPNMVDMSQGDFEIALSYGEEGKKRTMTTGEWEKLLRTDVRYGWEKTNNAKTEARALASNIAQAFGKII